ncbi:MAG: putative toxin-antitoxin system toxin component, PIN family [Deltaproteobacteria bacterium RIFCSPLOWO2_12_FULL_40_28]|nr:MAG: putative toxin-antitoxin system toxin component, PIN family [Deltaproteobacteria bacterium RIFCSPHIGHO2_02_FULL_40_28]OGQ20735.1 MAG: putative toxin-antitoxin system toxin component, PIN family [Deltaproteobacteria bacterium RIFCSPHIGHO2_12_FULL_40_32]OGQ41283.1 MAG: putative toxin-antitoxin system toxin component, PIN family [Deltaproteobacteria bacterium RIFCSPLOWO2_02_FULL_40_36]OGQ55347.1 MAG: putative toxin-antitoxin system toxin component, PIN family [Deltaproteobacteria bacterium 
MRIVFDTNVLIAAFIARGVCAELFEHCAIHHILVGSQFILDELHENLRKKFRYRPTDIQQIIDLLMSRWFVVKTPRLFSKVSRDPDDDFILATAAEGHCQCLITGDKDLLIIKNYQGIDILQPAQFWSYEKNYLR